MRARRRRPAFRSMVLGLVVSLSACRSPSPAPSPTVAPEHEPSTAPPASPSPWVGPPGTWVLMSAEVDARVTTSPLGEIVDAAMQQCTLSATALHHVDAAVGKDLSLAVRIDGEAIDRERAECLGRLMAELLGRPPSEVESEVIPGGAQVLVGQGPLVPVDRALVGQLDAMPGFLRLAVHAGVGEAAWSFDMGVGDPRTKVAIGLATDERVDSFERWLRRRLGQEFPEFAGIEMTRDRSRVLVSLEPSPELAGILRSRLAKPYKVPSGSMLPATTVGEHFWVDRMPPESGFARGDVVAFAFPEDPSQTFFKRIVAVAGDEVRWVGYSLEIKGVVVSTEPTSLDAADVGLPDEDTLLRPYVIHRERIGDAEHLILMPRSRLDRPDEPPPAEPWQVVPPGHVLVRGDHRSQSYDSSSFGPVSVDAIEGAATVIWLSIGPDGIRQGRMGRAL